MHTYEVTYMYSGETFQSRKVTYPSAKAARAAIRKSLHGSSETASFDGWIYRFDSRKWAVRRTKASATGRPTT